MLVTTYSELLSEQDWIRLKGDLGLPLRQAEVLRCVLGGMADKQIARATGISVNSVRGHMSRLFRKFGSNDRVELIICMFGHLRKYYLRDDSETACAAAYPSARNHSGQNADAK
jgi:DNA-binding CsgD family transcriptional regulator